MQQCGLCLSCGTPFMPIADDVDLFNHKGTLCVLYLHHEYKQNRTLQRQFSTPKFASDVQSSHVFHDSHHFPAINHMCNHHTGDSNVDWPAPHAGAIPPANTVIPPGPNGPLPYFKHPASTNAKGPSIATWTRPPAAQRLDFSTLLNHIVTAADLPDARPVAQNLDERLFICRGCNAIMTQLNNMEFHLGIIGMRAVNTRGPLIAGPVVRQYVANMRGASLLNAYGRWSKTAAAPSLNPRGNPSDDVSPHVAYYLHMCLPFVDLAHPDPFAATIATPNMRGPARILYLELSWIILEIACVATLRDQGKLYAPVGARSHGPHQHSGVLDVYVSYFLFRLLQFESGRQVQREGLDFVQWHQKYYWDAINCKDLFPPAARPAVLGTNAYTTTLQPSPALVVDICQGLMHMYTVELLHLRMFLTRNRVGLPVEITAYFLPLVSMRELRRRSGIRVIQKITHVFPPAACLIFFPLSAGHLR